MFANGDMLGKGLCGVHVCIYMYNMHIYPIDR